MKRVVATAPVRIDLAGGWTDVPPFADREGGVVVNIAIDHRTAVTIDLGGTDRVLRSEDLDQSIRLDEATPFVLDGTLDLHRVAVRARPFGAGTLRSAATVPPGSGLGSSGALGVALVASLQAQQGVALDPREIAEEAYRLESAEARHPGGRQDQYAAAFGGCHRFVFGEDGVTVDSKVFASGVEEALGDALVLVYTGQSRVSGDTIARVMGRYATGDPGTTGALLRLRETGYAMAEALMDGDLAQVGALLDQNWAAQQALDAGMRTPLMARLEHVARDVGVLGMKAVGAGAGGSILVLTENRQAIETAMVREGGQLIPMVFTTKGVCVEWD